MYINHSRTVRSRSGGRSISMEHAASPTPRYQPSPPSTAYTATATGDGRLMVRTSHTPLLGRNKYLKSRGKEIEPADPSFSSYIPQRHEQMFKRHGHTLFSSASPRRRNRRKQERKEQGLKAKVLYTKIAKGIIAKQNDEMTKYVAQTIGKSVFFTRNGDQSEERLYTETVYLGNERNNVVNKMLKAWCQTFSKSAINMTSGHLISQFETKFRQPSPFTTMLAVDLLYSFTGILPTDSRPVYSSIIENLLGAIFLNPDMIKIAKTRPTRFFDKIQNFNNRSVIADGIKCETIPSGYRHILDAVRNLKQQLSALTEECNNLRKFNERANELLREIEIKYQAKPCFALWFLNMKKYTKISKNQRRFGEFCYKMVQRTKRGQEQEAGAACKRDHFTGFATHVMKKLERRDFDLVWRVNVKKDSLSKILKRTIDSLQFLHKLSTEVREKVDTYPAKLLEKRRFVELIKSEKERCEERANREQKAQNVISKMMELTCIMGPSNNELLVEAVCGIFKKHVERKKNQGRFLGEDWENFRTMLPAISTVIGFLDPSTQICSALHIFARVVKSRCSWAEQKWYRGAGEQHSSHGWGWHASFQAIRREYQSALNVVHVDNIKTFRSAGEKNVSFLRFRRESAAILVKLQNAKVEFTQRSNEDKAPPETSEEIERKTKNDCGAEELEIVKLLKKRRTKAFRRKKSIVDVKNSLVKVLKNDGPPEGMTDFRKREWRNWERLAQASREATQEGKCDELHSDDDLHTFVRQEAIESAKRKELAAEKQFHNLPKEAMKEFCSKELDPEAAEYDFQNSLVTNARVIRRIFDHYKNGRRMNRPDYLRMVHESRVVDKENLRASDCELMWIKCASVPTDGHSNKRMMGPVAFLEAMCRMSRMKYRSFGLTTGFDTFVAEAAEYAIQSCASEWRHVLTDDVMARVIDRRSYELVSMHNFWSSRGVLSQMQWFNFITALGVVNEGSRLGVKRIPELFHNAQQHDDPHATKSKKKIGKQQEDGEVCDKHAENMEFSEFVEALATAIAFICPDPYEPTASKFERYVLLELFPAHQQKALNSKAGNK